MGSGFDKLYRILLQEKPHKSDAVVWLQGDRYDRAKNVLKLYKLGLAKKIIISGNNVLIGPSARDDEDNISLTEMEEYLLRNGVKKEDVLVDNGPLNTKEQAIHIAGLIKKNKWKSITLVGSAYGQPRTFLTFLKQLRLANLPTRIYNYPAVINSVSFPGGRKTPIDRLKVVEAEKIVQYQDDLASINEGIDYTCQQLNK